MGAMNLVLPSQPVKLIKNKLENINPVLKLDWQKFLKKIDSGAVDLVLTDPPYSISRDTGFANGGKNSIDRFAVSMDFGKWDHTEIDLKKFTNECYRVLRRGGTLIVWYDLWKISDVKRAMEASNFKMIRLIVWQKTNPVPLNQSATYLSNSREVAVVGVKGGKPTFKNKYDNGVYRYPIPRHNGRKVHPTQKPIELFDDLIKKHSEVDDYVIDPFAGSGTTGVAAIQNNRMFNGCDIDPHYVKVANERISESKTKIVNTKQSSYELFLELAQPDKDGFSREVGVGEFTGKYARLQLNSGVSWCRKKSKLAEEFKVVLIKAKGKIIGVKLDGRNQKSKWELFLELAQPDKDGFSREVGVGEFTGKYAILDFKKGRSWCQDHEALAKRFNIGRIKEKNRIIAIQLCGNNNSVPQHIKKFILSKRCVVLGISRVVVDRKNGRMDTKQLNDPNKVVQDDFQPLSKDVNDAKQQACKECRKTNLRFDAKQLEYPVSQVKGGRKYKGSCVGCFWHDPQFFVSQLTFKNKGKIKST